MPFESIEDVNPDVLLITAKVSPEDIGTPSLCILKVPPTLFSIAVGTTPLLLAATVSESFVKNPSTSGAAFFDLDIVYTFTISTSAEPGAIDAGIVAVKDAVAMSELREFTE